MEKLRKDQEAKEKEAKTIRRVIYSFFSLIMFSAAYHLRRQWLDVNKMKK